jgi:hypothetical protein
VRVPGIVGVSVALASTLAAWLVWRARRRRDLLPGPEALGATQAGRARFYAFVPLILGIHVGVPLIVLGIRGELFAPANALHGPGGLWLMLGLFPRVIIVTA